MPMRSVITTTNAPWRYRLSLRFFDVFSQGSMRRSVGVRRGKRPAKTGTIVGWIRSHGRLGYHA